MSGRGASPGAWGALAFWIAAGVGIMVKGPTLPLFVGLTVVGASLGARDVTWLRGLRPLTGVPIMAAVALPWYVTIWFATDGSFFAEAISHNVVGKITTGQQSHGFPPGFYALAVWVSFWPVTAVAATALPAFRHSRTPEGMRFVAAWVLPAWIVCELLATKLPHYVLPLYPAIALVAARGLALERINADRRWVRTLLAISTVGPAVIVVPALAGVMTLGSGATPSAIMLAVLAVALSIVALRLVLARALLAGWLVLAAGATLAAYACAFGVVAPRLDALWLSPRLATAVEEVSGYSDPSVVSVGNREASLVFAIGTDIRWGDPGSAASSLGEGPCRAAIIERDAVAEFVSALAARGIGPGPVTRVAGLNIGNTHFVEFDIYGRSRNEAGPVSRCAPGATSGLSARVDNGKICE